MLRGGNSVEKVLSFDISLVIQTAVLMFNMFILFLILSYFLFEPVKKVLAKRTERIKNEIDSAKSDKEKAASLKTEYENKIKNIQKEADYIVASARKKAIAREEEIIAAAKLEAKSIIEVANREVELEKEKVKDEMKREMITIASLVASKFIENSMDEKTQNSLIEETLREMGDGTWQS